MSLRIGSLLGAALLACGLQACVEIQIIDLSLHPLEETVVQGESGAKILLLDLDGVISEAAASARATTFGASFSPRAKLSVECDHGGQQKAGTRGQEGDGGAPQHPGGPVPYHGNRLDNARKIRTAAVFFGARFDNVKHRPKATGFPRLHQRQVNVLETVVFQEMLL